VHAPCPQAKALYAEDVISPKGWTGPLSRDAVVHSLKNTANRGDNFAAVPVALRPCVRTAHKQAQSIMRDEKQAKALQRVISGLPEKLCKIEQSWDSYISDGNADAGR